MIGHSLPEYVFIRISIAALRLIAPLSICYVAASWYAGHWIYATWLGYYAVVEACLYLLVYLPRNTLLQRPAEHPEQLNKEERQQLFARCFAEVRDTDHAIGWFRFSPANDIRRDNVVEWLLWAIFSATPDEMRDEWQEEIDGYVRTIEGLMGRQFAPGVNEELRCMRVSMDPVVALHRPLIWYLLVGLLDTYTCVYLAAKGFRHYTHHSWWMHFPSRILSILWERSPHPDLGYWYRPHRSKTKKPIVFFHGIGIGLWPYTPFLVELANVDPDVGIFAFENLSISSRISPPPLTRQHTLAALEHVLAHHGVDSFVVAGHSYGTVLAAWLLRSPTFSTRVAATLFIDPIPFLLHLPAVAYNFVYRAPQTANEWQLWYFASRDPDVSRALARHFFWSEIVLWKEDITRRRVAVVLSGRDQIVDAHEVRRYLTADEGDVKFHWRSEDGLLEVLWYPELDHSKVFDTPEDRGPMVGILARFVEA